MRKVKQISGEENVDAVKLKRDLQKRTFDRTRHLSLRQRVALLKSRKGKGNQAAKAD